ncbi:uncharacterized protein [Dermacentor albipictus]|uniref:uncharacterized protein n=1 Tax=Dermacentor albipictus TaxID=60249 RepID=UPI0038FCBABC
MQKVDKPQREGRTRRHDHGDVLLKLQQQRRHVPSQQPLPTCSTQTEESLQEFWAANIDGEEDHPVCDISNVRTPSPTASDAARLTDGLEAARRSKDPQPSNTPSASERVVDQAETSDVGADKNSGKSSLVSRQQAARVFCFCSATAQWNGNYGRITPQTVETTSP